MTERSPVDELETAIEVRLAPFVEVRPSDAPQSPAAPDDVTLTVAARRIAREIDIVVGAAAVEALEVDWRAAPRVLDLVVVVPGREADRITSPALEDELERALGFPLGVEIAPAALSSAHLEPDLAAGPAAARALLRLLTRARSYERGADLAEDDEEVHQLRVGYRRMRGAARMLRRAFPREIRPKLERAMQTPRQAMRRAGVVRDLDVILDDLRWAQKRSGDGDESLEAARDHVRQRRDKALAPMRRFLTSRSYRAGVQRLELLLLELSLDAGADRARSADEFARRRMRKEQERCKSAVAMLDVREPEQAHALRIAAKRLRYCAELVTDVVGRGERLARAAAGVQSVLGRERDAVRAIAFVDELAERRRVRPSASTVAVVAGLAMRRIEATASARYALAALEDALQ